MTKAASAAAKDLAAAGVIGVHLAWSDNNGIPRSRIVPVAGLADAASRGVGVTSLFAVFDTHDGITYEHSHLDTPSGDVRVIPAIDRLRKLAGQSALAMAPVRVLAADGSPWPYCQRTALERQVTAAAGEGLDVRAGYEIEFVVAPADSSDIAANPGHGGPAYSPHALIELDGFIATLLRDCAANGLDIGQLHAEYGLAQIELALVATDPVSAADDQLLARQTIHAAARAHNLRVSFAPVVSADTAGNGWHIHSSIWRSGRNLLTGDSGSSSGRPGAEGASYIAGLLRELPALTGVTAPSVPSTMRLRPGYFASAYGFWGVQNREAPLRYVPATKLLGAEHANIEYKPSDASANPYLALAALIAAGRSGIADNVPLIDPISADPGTWSAQRRAEEGVSSLPSTSEEQDQALADSAVIQNALGNQLFDAFRAVRASDRAWAAQRSVDEIMTEHLWRY